MDYLIIILAVAVSLAITFWPLRRLKRVWFVGDVESDLTVVIREREEALRALKDLEEDLLSRKLSRTDYDRLRPQYLERAKELTVKYDETREKLEAARKRVLAQAFETKQ
jgi:hypothetical protein